MLSELIDNSHIQYDLFHQKNTEELTKKNMLMTVLDEVNQRYGRHTLHLAAEGSAKGWDMRRDMLSPRYTTCWTELAEVR